jgi:hypothetical protein
MMWPVGMTAGRDDSSIHPAEDLVERVIGFLTQQQVATQGTTEFCLLRLEEEA